MNTSVVLHTEKETAAPHLILDGANATGDLLHHFVTKYKLHCGDKEPTRPDECCVIDLERRAIKVLSLGVIANDTWVAENLPWMSPLQRTALLHGSVAYKRKYVIVGDDWVSVVVSEDPPKETAADALSIHTSEMWMILHHLFVPSPEDTPPIKGFDAGAGQSYIIVGDYSESYRNAPDVFAWSMAIYRPFGMEFSVRKITRTSTRREGVSQIFGVDFGEALAIYDVGTPEMMSALAESASGVTPTKQHPFSSIGHIGEEPDYTAIPALWVEGVDRGYIVRSGDTVEIIPYIPAVACPTLAALQALTQDTRNRILEHLCDYGPQPRYFSGGNMASTSATYPAFRMNSGPWCVMREETDDKTYTRYVEVMGDKGMICTFIRTVPRPAETELNKMQYPHVIRDLVRK